MARLFRRSGGGEQAHDDAHAGDARLVDGLRRGAPAAFAGLHEQYAAGIYNLALRVVRHGADAEDITQDVLIRAFERVPQDREVLLRPWLYRLTLNRCYDHLRASRRIAPVDVEDAPSTRDLFEQSELQRSLEASLAALTPRQRAALVLKDVHGLSLVEVAACLELTPGSVEVLLARARKTFRGRYAEECERTGLTVPGAVASIAGLAWIPLPSGFLLPALPFAPPAHVVPPAIPASLPLSGGGGIAAALGLPASVKTAVLIAAAAATVGTAEVATTRTDRRPPLPSAQTTAVTVAGSATPAAAHEVTASPAAGRAAAAPQPSPSSSVAASPSPTATEVTPSATPLAIITPSATAEPQASPSPDDPGSHAATPSASPTASASATPSTLPSTPASPQSSGSPAPDAASSPGSQSSATL